MPFLQILSVANNDIFIQHLLPLCKTCPDVNLGRLVSISAPQIGTWSVATANSATTKLNKIGECNYKRGDCYYYQAQNWRYSVGYDMEVRIERPTSNTVEKCE